MDTEWKDTSDPDDDEDELPDLIPVDHSELADLLEESRLSEQVNEDIQIPEPEIVEMNVDDESNDDENLNLCEDDKSISEEVPELTSDEEGRPMRASRAPEQYDPSTGQSYA